MKATCPMCDGLRELEVDRGKVKCWTCGGTGTIETDPEPANKVKDQGNTCFVCRGAGMIGEIYCENCRGTGRIK